MSSLSQYLSGTYLPIWLALFPLTYLLHIAEEYWGGNGYSTYLLKNHGVDLSPARFLTLQSLGIALMIAGILLAVGLGFPQRMLVILASVILVNGLVHTGRSISGSLYEPGLITSIVLWIPLGGVTLLTLSRIMPTRSFLFAGLTGAAVSGLVEVISMRGGRLVSKRL
jgi:hypothetical protein